jgi:hypothetical protein
MNSEWQAYLLGRLPRDYAKYQGGRSGSGAGEEIDLEPQ